MFEAPRKVYLVGFMGSGKTTVGRHVAEALNMPFVDLDDYIEREEGKKVKQIFEEEGEEYFRFIETSAIRALIYTHPAVISCGGGAAVHNNNMTLMRNTVTSFYLHSTPEELAKRLIKEKEKRPLIASAASMVSLVAMIEEKLKNRSEFYEMAHHHIGTYGKTPDEIAQEITYLLNS